MRRQSLQAAPSPAIPLCGRHRPWAPGHLPLAVPLAAACACLLGGAGITAGTRGLSRRPPRCDARGPFSLLCWLLFALPLGLVLRSLGRVHTHKPSRRRRRAVRSPVPQRARSSSPGQTAGQASPPETPAGLTDYESVWAADPYDHYLYEQIEQERRRLGLPTDSPASATPDAGTLSRQETGDASSTRDHCAVLWDGCLYCDGWDGRPPSSPMP